MNSRPRSRRSGSGSVPGIVVAVTDARGRPFAGGAALGRWLGRHAPRGARGHLTIAIVSDATMRRLNRQFRGKDKVTDVLSFLPEAGTRAVPGLKGRFLGDLAIARGVAARQARQLGHPVPTELRILALHGLLHLLGYDHETDRGEMGRLEDQLRQLAGLPAGLIARH
jgi:probable rRNA maturation factor